MPIFHEDSHLCHTLAFAELTPLVPRKSARQQSLTVHADILYVCACTSIGMRTPRFSGVSSAKARVWQKMGVIMEKRHYILYNTVLL